MIILISMIDNDDDDDFLMQRLVADYDETIIKHFNFAPSANGSIFFETVFNTNMPI